MPLHLAQAFELIQDTLNSLLRIGLIDQQEVAALEDTVLLGGGSPLDSIAFVTFITELEDRLSRAENKDLFLVLKDIHNFNADNANLSVGTLARYLVKLTEAKA
jgi:acyl carrier protein